MRKTSAISLHLVASLLFTVFGCGQAPADFETNLQQSAQAAAKGKDMLKVEPPQPGARRPPPGTKGKLADDDTF
jgi:hypothetical protein